MVKSGQPWAGTIVTLDGTGALAAASVGPAGTLYVDGVSNAASVTVTGSNPYKWAVTLPALTAGQSVSMYVTATVGGIATAAVVAEDIADTKRVSDLNDAAAAPSAATVADAVMTKTYNGYTEGSFGNVNEWVPGVVAVASQVRIELATELGRINTPLSNIETDTQDIQGRLPAALVSGRIDSSTGAMAANVLTAAAIAENAIDADALTDDAIDAILDEVIEGSVTMRQLLRGFAAVLLGKSTNSGADYRDLADSKTRVDSTLDGSGNRTAVTLDLT